MTVSEHPVSAARGVSKSVWLTAQENELLKQVAERAGVSQNALLRIGLRRMLGLPRVSSSRVEAILDDLTTS